VTMLPGIIGQFLCQHTAIAPSICKGTTTCVPLVSCQAKLLICLCHVRMLWVIFCYIKYA